MVTPSVPAAPRPVIDENGLSLPTFEDVWTWMKSVYRSIYGDDIYIESDSQDGQLIGILSEALHDAYSEIGSAYEAFSPTTAQGVGLSRMVKINGLRRKSASLSSVDLRIVGWAGTVIRNGSAQDTTGQRWLLPAEVIIPAAAEIIVTAVADRLGDVFAAAHTITRINTPQRGWQSVDNPAASTIGAPVETDPQLRVRQSISTSLPAKSAFESLVGAVAEIAGTNRYRGYENETTGPDERGIPQNSVAIVVEGGDVSEIARVIYKKKTPGVITYGTTSEPYVDGAGIAHSIRFSRPVQVPVQVTIPIKPLARYTEAKDLAIRSAVSNWINARPIGETLFVEEIPTPARLITEQFPDGDPTFKIRPPVKIGPLGGTLAEVDLVVSYDGRVTCSVGDVVLQVVS
jgi:uncharacterized phage protein gp47/JayE